jgi:hypothetical protein
MKVDSASDNTISNDFNDETKLQCVICMDDYDTTVHQPQTLPTCGHTFCSLCISRLTNKQCPYDRIPFASSVNNDSLLADEAGQAMSYLFPFSQHDSIEQELPSRESLFHSLFHTPDCLAVINKCLHKCSIQNNQNLYHIVIL